MADYGLIPSGFAQPRADELITQIRAAYEARLRAQGIDDVPDWDHDTFYGAITAVMGIVLGEAWDAPAMVYDAIDPNNASDGMLDTQLATVGMTREEATFSTVLIELTGTPGTPVPVGKVVRSRITGAAWELIEDAILPATVVFRARDPGPVLAPLGTLTEIGTPVAGWNGAINFIAATPGQAKEGDAEARRRKRARLAGGGGPLGRMQRAIEALPEVKRALIVQNDSTTTQTVEGITLTPHSFQVVVYPPALTLATQQAISRIIYEQGQGGIEPKGPLAHPVLARDGALRDVAFSLALARPVAALVFYTLEPGSTVTDGEAEAQMAQAIRAYFDGLSVGDEVRTFHIEAALATVEDLATASVELALDGGIFLGQDLEMTAVQFAVLTTVSFA